MIANLTVLSNLYVYWSNAANLKLNPLNVLQFNIYTSGFINVLEAMYKYLLKTNIDEETTNESHPH